MSNALVAIVVFGKKSTTLLARLLSRNNIDYGIVYPGENPRFVPTHIILSGGPKHVYEKDHYPMPRWVIDSDAPVLGICYGMQLIAKTFGGSVHKMQNRETGSVLVTEIIDNIQVTKFRWMNRHDQVTWIPSNFTITGVTQKNHIACFTDYEKWWAVQYHPESTSNEDFSVIQNFLNVLNYMY